MIDKKTLNVLSNIIKNDSKVATNLQSSILLGNQNFYEATASIAHKCWVKKDSLVNINGLTITSGLIYVGVDLYRGNGKREPSVINTSFKVGEVERPLAMFVGQHINSYQLYSPKMRHEYLQWHADGRTSSDIPLKYLRLFVGGLERRLFEDYSDALGACNDDIRDIYDELRRLQSLFPEETGLQSLISAVRFSWFINETKHPTLLTGIEQAVNRKDVDHLIAIGTLNLEGKPLSNELAFQLTASSPHIGTRTPASRCFREYHDLFKILFDEQYPNGIKLDDPSCSPLVYRYNCNYTGGRCLKFKARHNGSHIYNFDRPGQLISKLDALSNKAEALLTPYSRYMAVKGRRTDSLAIAAHLPEALKSTTTFSGVLKLHHLLSKASRGNSYRAISCDNLILLWDGRDVNSLNKSDSISLVRIASSIGYGIEPDVRYGGDKLTKGSCCVVFQSKDEQGSDIPLLKKLLLASNVAAHVWHNMGISEKHYILFANFIKSHVGIDDHDKARALANFTYAANANLRLSLLKRKSSLLSKSSINEILNLIIKGMTLHGEATHKSIKLLDKIYNQLGINNKVIFSSIHKAALGEDNPDKDISTHRVPLDKELLAVKIRETNKAQKILNNALTTDDPVIVQKENIKPQNTLGLDDSVYCFLSELAIKELWGIFDLKILAKKNNILLQGAIETINDLALDKCGDILIDEDDEEFVFYTDIYEELISECN